MGLNGIFCANFGSDSTFRLVCKSGWCGACYVPLPGDRFHINYPTDGSGFIWKKKSDESRFKVGRNGDHLICPFQCDTCIFYLLKNRSPNPFLLKDELLQICIRRANLDAMWGRETSTVIANKRNVKRAVDLADLAGIKPNFEPLGPYPNKDLHGLTTAIIMLLRSLDPGKYAPYSQFETIRKIRSAYSNTYMASVTTSLAASTLGRTSNKFFLTQSPTQSLWFERFCTGCLKRMGQIVKQDLAISIDVLL